MTNRTSTNTAEKMISRIESACEAAFSAAADYGTTTCATVVWESDDIAGVRIDFEDGRFGVAEVWFDGEYSWVVEFAI